MDFCLSWADTVMGKVGQVGTDQQLLRRNMKLLAIDDVGELILHFMVPGA